VGGSAPRGALANCYNRGMSGFAARVLLVPAALLLLGGASGQEERPSPRVVVVPVAGPLGAAHLALLRRAVATIQANPPDLVLFEIDSPGGRIDHMLSMGELIAGLAPIPTAAYVRPLAQSGVTGGAWSAGAYLALCCRRLYMHPGTVIGAAAPMAQTGEGAKPVDEKYVSAFREKFRARAEQNGFPPSLAAAMVDQDLEVFEVEIDGERRYHTAAELDRLRSAGRTFDWPSTPYVAEGKLLTLTDRQVVETGMGRLAASRAELYAAEGLSGPREIPIEPTWSEALVGFLTSPVVAMVLLAGGILGIWIELKTPGFGVPGIVGIVALAIFLFGHHLAGLAGAPEIALIVLGLALLAAELFLIPGFGVAGVAGILCVFVGLILAFQDFAWPDPREAPWQVDLLVGSVGRVLFSFLAAGLGFLAVLRYLPKVPLLGRLVHQSEISGAAPGPAPLGDLQGRHARALTPLRPAGKVEIDGRVLDVVADGDFVAESEPVEILRVDGPRIVVSKVKR